MNEYNARFLYRTIFKQVLILQLLVKTVLLLLAFSFFNWPEVWAVLFGSSIALIAQLTFNGLMASEILNKKNSALLKVQLHKLYFVEFLKLTFVLGSFITLFSAMSHSSQQTLLFIVLSFGISYFLAIVFPILKKPYNITTS